MGAGLAEVLSGSRQNVGSRSVGPMLPETERMLRDFFRPFVARLADLLGDQRFLWKDVTSTPTATGTRRPEAPVERLR